MPFNDKIIEQFTLLTDKIKEEIDNSSGKDQITNSFRLKNISNVLNIIKKLQYTIKKGEDLQDIKGIGKRSVDRINEILQKGKLSELDNYIKNNYNDILDELQKVHGIGKKFAFHLYNKHNIKSIDDLKIYHKKGKIKLNDTIIKGLNFYDKIKENIPRSEVDKIYIYLLKKAFKLDKYLHLTLCGSYRRLNNFVNDIDVILVHPDKNLLHDFINLLINDKFIIESLTSTDIPTKYMGICKYKNNPFRRIDIRFIPYESYYSAILYFTGSKNFNRDMRKIAIQMGYKLNEYGLYKNGEQLKISSEKDVFDILEMDYLTPNKRI